jgi:flagellar biosynthesis GTPase FlhF
MYPSSRFTIVLKSPKEWEKYCEDLCNLFGILKKTHPLILFSNGNKIGGAQEFFKLISESFKYDKLIKKGNEYVLDIDPGEVTKLTKENTKIIEKEYFCRTKGNYIIDKINNRLDQIPDKNFMQLYSKYNTIETDYTSEFIEDMKVYVKYDNKFTPNPKDYINYEEVMESRPAYVDKEKYHAYHEELRIKIETEIRLKREAEEAEKRRIEEEQRKKEEALRAEEESKETEANKGKKDRRKKEEERRKKKEEEERKKKEEEERKKKEEEERKMKEEEEQKRKEEEEQKRKEEEEQKRKEKQKPEKLEIKSKEKYIIEDTNASDILVQVKVKNVSEKKISLKNKKWVKGKKSNEAVDFINGIDEININEELEENKEKNIDVHFSIKNPRQGLNYNVELLIGNIKDNNEIDIITENALCFNVEITKKKMMTLMLYLLKKSKKYIKI